MQPDGLIPRSPGVPGSLGHGTWLGRSALGLAALCLSWVAVSSAWICDDYYYSLRAAYNLVHGHGLVSNPVERVQGFSNPLWTLLLSASVLVDGYSWAITIGLSLVISLVVVVVLARWSAPNMGVALVGLSLLAGSKAFMDYSTSGLENTLAHLLYLGFLTLWAGASGPAARAGRLGLLAALLVWTRLDLCLLVLPHLLLLVRRPVLGTVARLAAGMLPLAAWLAFALIYYGSPFPNSAWTKLGDAGLERGLLIHRGWCYLVDSLTWDRLTLPAIVVALVAALAMGRRNRRGRHGATALGIILYLVYIIWIGGDFMVGRFLSVPLIGAAFLLVRAPRWSGRWSPVAGIVLILLASLSSPRSPLRTGREFEELPPREPKLRYQVADERLFYYRLTGLLPRLGRGELGQDLKSVGNREQGVLVNAYGEEPYFMGPHAHAMNYYGITDPLVARLPPELPNQLRAGHVARVVPQGYKASLRARENRIKEPAVAALWDDLVLVTRGPLWTGARWAAIWRLHSGFYNQVRRMKLKSDL